MTGIGLVSRSPPVERWKTVVVFLLSPPAEPTRYIVAVGKSKSPATSLKMPRMSSTFFPAASGAFGRISSHSGAGGLPFSPFLSIRRSIRAEAADAA